MLPFALLTSLLFAVDVACGRNVWRTEESSSPKAERCSLANHIKSNTRWRYVKHKDPSGKNTTDAPLPLVSPYTSKSEEEINKQINRELFAHYTYLSMAMHFDRDDINLPGFHKFFKESAEEEMKQAQKLMKYQNMRGGRVKLHHIMKPCEDHWGNGLDAMKEALKLEWEIYLALLDLHNVAAEDPQLRYFLESEYLGEQVESIKKLSNYVNNLKRLAKENYALGEYQFDQVTLGGERKNTTDAPLPLVSSFTRQSEEEISKKINSELFAHYTYLSMAMHFDRDDINLPGFHKFFKESKEEEMKHAQKLMKYQNMRGGRVKLHHIMKPFEDHWGNGLDTMKEALKLEWEIYQALLDLHIVAAEDPQLQDFLDSEYLGEQVESIKELSNYVNTLKRLAKENYALGEYQFDQVTLGGESKE